MKKKYWPSRKAHAVVPRTDCRKSITKKTEKLVFYHAHIFAAHRSCPSGTADLPFSYRTGSGRAGHATGQPGIVLFPAPFQQPAGNVGGR